MITNLAHICLSVADLSRTMDFYGNKLGLPSKFTFEKNGKAIGVYFAISPGAFIEVFEGGNGKAVNTGITHFCLETDDLDRCIEMMNRNGVACTPKKMGCDQSWQTWVQDPDGNKIEIHQYTPNSAQRKGGTVAVDW